LRDQTPCSAPGYPPDPAAPGERLQPNTTGRTCQRKATTLTELLEGGIDTADIRKFEIEFVQGTHYELWLVDMAFYRLRTDAGS